jgi:hypothetical protein
LAEAIGSSSRSDDAGLAIIWPPRPGNAQLIVISSPRSLSIASQFSTLLRLMTFWSAPQAHGGPKERRKII